MYLDHTNGVSIDKNTLKVAREHGAACSAAEVAYGHTNTELHDTASQLVRDVASQLAELGGL